MRHRRAGRRPLRSLRPFLLGLVVAGTLAVSAAPAFAHAALVASTPSDGQTLEAPPAEIRLEFNEPVSPPVGAVRVFDAAGTRVDMARTSTEAGGTVIVAPLDGTLTDGTYVVSWRAVSADGHPVRGAYFFHIGEASGAIEDSRLAEMLGSGGDRPFAIAAAMARWLTYLAGLLVAGAIVFLNFVGAGGAHGAIVRVVRLACVVGALASFAQIPVFAAQTTGLGLSALTSATAWGDALTGTVGVAALLRVAAFAAVAAVFPTVTTGLSRLVGWAAVIALVTAELWTGHTRTTEPVWLVWGADAIHVLGAATWFGGLVALAITMRHQRDDDDPVAAAGTVARFSGLAAVSVVALGIAGGALTWTQVRALHALTSTTYGWTLIAKLAIVAAVLGVALYNNRVLVRKIGDTTSEDQPRRTAWRRLGSTIRWEIAGIVAVLAVTAVLVNIQPAAEAAGVSGPYSTYVDFGEGQLNLVVDPNRVGMNDIHVYILTAGGLPAITEGRVTLEISLPSEEIGPFVREAQFAGPGHFLHTGPELALPGTWEIIVQQRVSEFATEDVTVPVVVNR